MDDNMISLVVAAVALLVAMITFFLWNRERRIKKPQEAGESTRPLQLQAYERLVVLVERIAIPNLISRTSQPAFSAREMQALLIESIKQETEYNSSQQIYVNPAAWEAVRNLKDQNILIINQVAAALPADAKGIDLNKKLLEFVMNQQKGTLHTIVLEALNYEAKKLLR